MSAEGRSNTEDAEQELEYSTERELNLDNNEDEMTFFGQLLLAAEERSKPRQKIKFLTNLLFGMRITRTEQVQMTSALTSIRQHQSSSVYSHLTVHPLRLCVGGSMDRTSTQTVTQVLKVIKLATL